MSTRDRKVFRHLYILNYFSRLVLQEAHGTIVNIVDIHAQRPFKQHTIYCMAKAALQMMTYSLAKELAQSTG